jgi:hypothetical protein
MKSVTRHDLLSLVLAAGILDSLTLSMAAFAAIMNISGTQPELSVWIVLLSIALVVVLAVTATVDEGPGRRDRT